MEPIQVTCAIIRKDGLFLAAQRSSEMSLPLKWEFPGGKIDPGESPEVCIVREIREELGCEIEVEATWEPVHYAGQERPIVLIPLLCQLRSGQPQALEHSQLRWISLEEIREPDWAEADLGVLLQLEEKFGNGG